MASTTAAAFGNAVRAERLRRGMSQAQLTKAAGLRHSHVSAIERGVRSPTLNTIAKLARGLQMTPADLVRGLDAHIPRKPL
jgi:transcriptional regulator with XRE-family HTH domain